jgi:hypothetical protein
MTWLAGELGGLDLLANCAGLLRGYPVSSPEAESNTVAESRST